MTHDDVIKFQKVKIVIGNERKLEPGEILEITELTEIINRELLSSFRLYQSCKQIIRLSKQFVLK